jgi:lactoylglutathione lyase
MTVDAIAADPQAAAAEPLETRSVHLSLTAHDLSRSIAWYRDVLGFIVEYTSEDDGKPKAAGIRSGHARIYLNQDDGGRGWERVKGEGFAITFDTAQDVDALAAGIKARGGTVTMEPTDMPWGVRMFRLVDPDGYRLAIWRSLKA